MMALVEQIVTICNKKGLHARAAAKFVKTAGLYDADVRVVRLIREGEQADEADPDCNVSARSILGLMMLGAAPGCHLKLQATGLHAREAIDALAQLVESRFDEEE